ncbi:hypothetical protein HC766_06465 [Candidatus Gracilibacteria bacterium]|nr:hypothetical protein [Candidatus Gracilibacteria bacterium]
MLGKQWTVESGELRVESGCGAARSIDRLRVGSQQQTVEGGGLTDRQLLIIDDRLPITNYQLPITNYQLPITNLKSKSNLWYSQKSYLSIKSAI